MRKFFSLILALLCLFSLFSCGDGESGKENTRLFYDYFDTWGTLYDFSGARYSDFSKVADEVEKILKEYHELCDIYNKYEGKNNLATVNEMAGRGPVEVDEKLIELLEYSKEIYYLTNGETNVAFGSVLKIWHEYREAGVDVPDITELEEANLHTDIEKMVINHSLGTVELLDSRMSLDVGAVAKGYAVEMVAEYLKEKELSSYFFDMGGNLRAIGEKSNGVPFSSAVQNVVLGGYAARFELFDSALVTSGSYVRYYTVDGINYHHIIDKDTLFPKNDYVSVSVKATSSALADALSTALFNMDIQEAEVLLGKLTGVSAVFVKPDGQVVKIEAGLSH
ncbi:MAG: FAD:protein FMN transferase [Clostridia bacterium]|nr:FAD:protein FMN transferase [Clostridia bacterium]